MVCSAGSQAVFGKPYNVSGFATRTRLRIASFGTHTVKRSSSSASSGLLLSGLVRIVRRPDFAVRIRARQLDPSAALLEQAENDGVRRMIDALGYRRIAQVVEHELSRQA